MLLSHIVLPILISTTASASSLIKDSANTTISMAADTGPTTIEHIQLVCTTDKTTCFWFFKIKPPADTDATPCGLLSIGNPAWQATASGPDSCGRFTVTAGWSGQFGPGNGFTTLAIVDTVADTIIYPAYTDAQVVGGKVVVPDQSYPVQTLA